MSLGRVEVWVDGGDRRVAEGIDAWQVPFRISDIGPGDHTVFPQSFDTAGNPSDIHSVTFVILSAGVVPITITNPVRDQQLVPRTTITMSGAASPGPGATEVTRVQPADELQRETSRRTARR